MPLTGKRHRQDRVEHPHPQCVPLRLSVSGRLRPLPLQQPLAEALQIGLMYRPQFLPPLTTRHPRLPDIGLVPRLHQVDLFAGEWSPERLVGSLMFRF